MPSVKDQKEKSGMTPTFLLPECWMELPSNEMANTAPEAVLKGKMEVHFELTTSPTSGNAEQVVWSTEGKPGLEI